ncbi:MAG: hypothetical protein SGJ10_12780 [Bacteroidota bacterium]|nr:hypothetical protein [Bacteroidota bacterium]
MSIQKKLGIWMDHSNAHIMEFTADPIETTILESKFTQQQKEASLNKSEQLMHNKEQHQQADYYKNLGNIIKDYNEVLLFGPTDAKVELLNILRADHRFEKVKIDILPADKMTENQQHSFVRKHFSHL